MAKRKVQLGSDEWKKEIDGICKTIIKKMEGAKREEGSAFFPFFGIIQNYCLKVFPSAQLGMHQYLNLFFVLHAQSQVHDPAHLPFESVSLF